MLDVVRPALNENGVFLRSTSEVVENVHVAPHGGRSGENPSMLSTRPHAARYDSDPQEFGKRETYAPPLFAAQGFRPRWR
ncbi:MAG: hypothetical protein ACLTSX_12610 [Collinsella sp.]